MRWGESTTLEFVKIYLKHECLWNPEHMGYKMRYEREKAYYAICSEFKSVSGKSMSIPEIKVKIKNLRTTYIQQVHKILKKSSPDAIYEPSLVWFHEMDRCLKHVPINRHSTNDETKQPLVDSSGQVWLETESQNVKSEEANPDPLNSQTDDEYFPDQSEEIQIKKEHRSSFRKIKKKKLKRRSLSASYMPDSNTSGKETKEVKEDEFDIYGKFIASQLRKMNIQKALRLQLEIQSLVSEARISDL